MLPFFIYFYIIARKNFFLSHIFPLFWFVFCGIQQKWWWSIYLKMIVYLRCVICVALLSVRCMNRYKFIVLRNFTSVIPTIYFDINRINLQSNWQIRSMINGCWESLLPPLRIQVCSFCKQKHNIYGFHKLNSFL